MELDAHDESEVRPAAFTDQAAAVMFLKDRGGRYRFVNRSFLARFGLRRDQVLGRTDAELFPHPYAGAYAANDARVLARAEPIRVEEIARYVDGDCVSIVVKFPVFDAAGAVVGVGGVATDVTADKRSEQALSRRLVEAEEAERRRLARELHDRVGQNLSALNINLDIVLGQLGESGPQELRVRLRDSLALVDATLQTIENVMADLRPPLLEEYGLGAALGWHAEDFMRRTGVRIEFEDGAKERIRSLRREAAVALFRIAQEALSNVAKHAQATTVRMRLEADDARLALAIADDGLGFDAGALPAGRYGMKSMRERAEAVGGEFEVRAAPGEGAAVRVSVPLA